jgi:hypothetical protein
MNKIRSLAGLLVLFITFPMSVAQTYFLYKHVHAPDIVWTLWLINLPVLLIANGISAIVFKEEKK